MLVNKCSRCGHEIHVNKPKEISEIQCKHCNKEFTIDKKTKYRAMALVVISIFAFSFLVTLFSQILDISPYILLIPLIILSFFMYNFALFLLAKFNKVSYDSIE